MFKFSLKKIIIGIVVLVILAVLIVNWDKNMLYGDTFYPISRFHIEKLFYNWQIITTDIYFGGDNSEYISGKELNNILLYLPQILNSVLYYVITFLLSFLYIQTIFNKKKYLLIRIFSATLLTFNVFSVFFN